MYLAHQMRVIDESKEVVDRLSRLIPFFESHTFAALPDAEKILMRMQAKFMAGYSECLSERIKAFQRAH